MEISELAVPSVYCLIFFLGYPSQWLLMHLEPAPLSKNELIAANVALVLILITYTKSVFVEPGRIPRNWAGTTVKSSDEKEMGNGEIDGIGGVKSRKWCRRCDAAKPPRAHHYVYPKWTTTAPGTNNCVSHTTFPHFLRFLLYTTAGLSLLQSIIFTRLSHLWTTRDMPSYLGPSLLQLSHLFTVTMVNSITLFILGILLLRNLWCLCVNTTTIEGWEIERHTTLLRRARQYGGYLSSPDGAKVRIRKQEFPYDIGIWSNIVQGMGTANPISWFNPLAGTPSLKSGLTFETNGFEDEGTVWPPPDPDRAYRRSATAVNTGAFVYENSELNDKDTLAAFKVRQAEDAVRRRRPFFEQREDKAVERDEDEYVYGDDASDAEEEIFEKKKYGDAEGEAAWRNSEGERLKDFGVDEDVEFYDEQDDDIPLSELMARRQAASASTSAYKSS